MKKLRDHIELDEIHSKESYVAEPLNKENLELAEMMLRFIIHAIKSPMDALQILNS